MRHLSTTKHKDASRLTIQHLINLVSLWPRLTKMLIMQMKMCRACDDYVVNITENWGKLLPLPTTFYYPIGQEGCPSLTNM